MEIKLEQVIFQSGTIGVCCRSYMGDSIAPTIVNEYNVHKFRECYSFSFAIFLVEGGKIKQKLESGCDVNVDSDLVENPKSLTQYDWQLLKIIHPEVQHYQWEVFRTLKDLVDNRVEEEYTLAEIKLILQQENKIES